jgi:esterase/lipase superfamily enzyme
MEIEYHHWWSPRLGQKFELKVYGRAGRPMMAFPTARGRFYDYENFGMAAACAPLIDSGRLQVFSVDGRDWETWADCSAHPADRGRRYEQWESCLLHEALPFLASKNGRVARRELVVTGCSAGAFHAANFFFRHPENCGAVIGLSGVYGLRRFVGEYVDEWVYAYDPNRYLPILDDQTKLALYRGGRIILCCGQGAWEEECLEESRRLSGILAARDIPHWLDLWGCDVSHDWPWWRKQIIYFLEKLGV